MNTFLRMQRGGDRGEPRRRGDHDRDFASGSRRRREDLSRSRRDDKSRSRRDDKSRSRREDSRRDDKSRSQREDKSRSRREDSRREDSRRGREDSRRGEPPRDRSRRDERRAPERRAPPRRAADERRRPPDDARRPPERRREDADRRRRERDVDDRPRKRRKEDDRPKKRRRKEDDEGDDKDDSQGHYEGKAGETIDGRYEIVGEAGLGTFGRVVDCVDLKHAERRRVALKVVRRIERYTESAAVEAEILRDVNATARANGEEGGKLCVQLFETFEFQGHYCLAFERVGTSLYDYLKSNSYRPFASDTVRRISRQLLESLRFLHAMKLVHTDLKLENVLLRKLGVGKPQPDADGKCQLSVDEADIVVIDFGGATYDDERKSSIVNTRQYRAPEVILNLGWSTPSDLWSAGCIVAELGKGELLFATHSNTEHLALIERAVGPFPPALVQRSRYATKYFDADARSTWEASLPRDGRDHVRRMTSLREYCAPDMELHELLAGLLTIDPDRRLTAKEALGGCPFLARC